ncbi:NERD domain-containing protein/DEAD/DEAH box helicase [Idiomarina sp.]|uniref:NERD domain-containing protein/DEAD/DEAH box helicase n=1 Tax=Idiomarina sp. TaxID=1874361 RepID=UPI003A93C96F
MGLKIFRGEAFEHTHENRFFDFLCDALTHHCESHSHDWHLLGNVHVGSRELDALLVKPNAIIALDFKDYGGKLQFSEAGPWKIKTPEGADAEVKGGASVNPFVQLKKNKRALVEFFQSQFSDLQCNWGHVAAAVVFQQPMEMDYGAVPGHLNRWFHITDQASFVRDLENIVSREIRFDYDDQDQIPELLGIEVYKVPKIRVSNAQRQTYDLSADPSNSEQQSELTLTQSQHDGLGQFEKWLSQGEEVFQLKGMINTGKRELLPLLKAKAVDAGYLVQFLAPSKRIARRYAGLGIEVGSAYSYLYSQSPTSIEDDGGRKVAIHEIRTPTDLSKTIVIVLDAHLFSDAELMRSDRRYGSGRLINDFLEMIKKEGSRLVAIGDPYQLGRAGEESSLLLTNVYDRFELAIQAVELNENISREEDSALEKLQLELVKSMKKSRFNALQVSAGKRLHVLEGGDKSWKPDLQSNLQQSMMLVPTKGKAAILNNAVKSKLLKHTAIDSIQEGDWVDFYNRTPVLSDDTELDDPFLDELARVNFKWIDSGSLGRVVKVLDEEFLQQELRGRGTAAILHFVRLKVIVQGLGEVECRCLLNFTNSQDNELSPDEMVALNVIARSKAKTILSQRKSQLPDKKDPSYREKKLAYDLWELQTLQSMGYASAAFIKLAHSMTVHRAQGRVWPETWINAQEGPNGTAVSNKNYFQWLYTASLTASNKFFVQNPPHVSPLMNLLHAERESFEIQYMQVKRPLYYSRDRSVSPEEASQLSKLAISDSLIPMAITLFERAEILNFRLVGWKESQYRVQAQLAKPSEEDVVSVVLNYDKDLRVKSFKVDAELLSDTEDKQALYDTLQGKFIAQDANAEDVYESLRRVLDRHQVSVLSVIEHPYQLILSLQMLPDTAEVKVIFNGEGFVTKFSLLKASSESIANLLERVTVQET